MHRVIKYIPYTLLLVSNISCRHSMKAVDYAAYVNNEKNGLKKTVEVDGWSFCTQYRPYEYVMLMENKGNSQGYDFSKRLSQLRGTAWFTLSIKRIDNSTSPMRYGISSIEDYNRRLNYYLNEAVNDIKLVYDKDTLHPESYLFENNYNLSPEETMVVGFYLPRGDDHPGKEMRFSLVDRIFKSGIINAEYSSRVLEKIPALVY